MKTELIAMKDVLVETFTPQMDMVAASKCRLVQGMMRLTFQLMLHTATMGFGIVPSTEIAQIEEFGEFAVSAIKDSIANGGELSDYGPQAELVAELVSPSIFPFDILQLCSRVYHS